MQTQTSNSLHNAIMEAGSKDRFVTVVTRGVVFAITLVLLKVTSSTGSHGWRQLVDTKVRMVWTTRKELFGSSRSPFLYQVNLLETMHNEQNTVVGDTKGAVFGGLVEATLRPSIKKRYEGSNNTFVFTNASGPPVIFRPTGTAFSS
nr:hypothetical protein [Tanacetum cinerariifolium]